MKYWNLVHVKGKSSSIPAQTLPFTTLVEPPKYFNETNLNDDEIAEVMSILMEYHDKYFKEIPLAKSFCEKFVWNLPKHIYDIAIGFKNKNEPDAINPLYWFYLFCMENVESSMGKFIINALNSIPESDCHRIEELANIYDDEINI